MDPTYVCTDSGIRGVGGKNGPNSRIWGALHDLIGETRDFPINWEGPGRPVPAAPEQGMVFQSGNIDKYDIIGFASMKIVDVLSVDETQGGVGTCATKNNSPVTWTATGQTLNLNTITSGTSGWQGCPGSTPDQITGDPILTKAKNNDPACCTPGGGLHLRWVDPDDHLAGDKSPEGHQGELRLDDRPEQRAVRTAPRQ